MLIDVLAELIFLVYLTKSLQILARIILISTSELLQVRLSLLDLLLAYLYGHFFLTLTVFSGPHLLSWTHSLLLDQTRYSVDDLLLLDLMTTLLAQ